MLKEGLGLGLSTAGGGGSASTTCTTTPAAYIASNPDLSILSSALQSSGLSTSLNSYYSAYTIFAPTNAAFETLFSQKGTTLEALQTTNPDILALVRSCVAYVMRACHLLTISYHTTDADSQKPCCSR